MALETKRGGPARGLTGRQARLRPAAITCAAGLLLVSSAFACDGRRPERPAATATTVVRYSWDSGGPTCVDPGLRWGATPIAVPPGPGRSMQVAETSEARELRAAGELCAVTHTFTHLLPGRWRVWVGRAEVPGMLGRCDVELGPGGAIVDLSHPIGK